MMTNKKSVSLLKAIIGFVLTMGVVIAGIRFKVGMQVPLIMGTMAAAFYAMYLGNKWKDIQQWILDGISRSMVANLILILSGILVGIWIVGGTVPTLIYYGLEMLSPSTFLPVTFLICIMTSLATGTSFGTISTVGLALTGVSMGLGIPLHITVGAIVSGAFFGDKMSPISDTTNIAPAMAGSKLFDHIGSMMWTTTPAAIISLVLYWVVGRQYTTGTADMVVVEEILQTMNSNFNISFLTVLPPILLIFLSMRRVPAIPTLSITVLFSSILPIFTQGVAIKSILGSAMSGYTSTSGVEVVDKILSRGGITMMTDSVIMIIAATAMGGILDYSGILSTVIDALLKRVKSYRGLIATTLISTFAVVFSTGNMIVGIVLPGRTFKKAYEDMDIHPKVLSRCLEDVGTLTNSIIPWGGACIFIQAVLSVDLSYIPYTFLNYLTPLISLIFGLLGIAVWNRDGVSVLKLDKENS